MKINLFSKLVGYLALALILAIPGALAAQGFDEGPGDEPEELLPIDSLAELASGAVEDNCTCPESDSDSAIKKFESCLAKQSKKASKAFKASLRFLNENPSEFNEVLKGYLESYQDDCMSGGAGEEDPGDEDPADEF